MTFGFIALSIKLTTRFKLIGVRNLVKAAKQAVFVEFNSAKMISLQHTSSVTILQVHMN
jgi:hypothetical protein